MSINTNIGNTYSVITITELESSTFDVEIHIFSYRNIINRKLVLWTNGKNN